MFNINKLSTIKSYTELYNYCKKGLGFSNMIGEGSGRIVFQLSDDYVLKIAKNRFGNYQNKAEFDFLKTHKDIQKLFPKIYRDTKDKNNMYIICEYVLPVIDDDVKEVFNLSSFGWVNDGNEYGTTFTNTILLPLLTYRELFELNDYKDKKLQDIIDRIKSDKIFGPNVNYGLLIMPQTNKDYQNLLNIVKDFISQTTYKICKKNNQKQFLNQLFNYIIDKNVEPFDLLPQENWGICFRNKQINFVILDNGLSDNENGNSIFLQNEYKKRHFVNGEMSPYSRFDDNGKQYNQFNPSDDDLWNCN